MIKIKKLISYNWENAIHGMRSPLESWELSDSLILPSGDYILGDLDKALMKKLTLKGGADRKVLRQIRVSFISTANLKFFDQFATYEFKTSNSTSQMHNILKRDVEFKTFSCEITKERTLKSLDNTIKTINSLRESYHLAIDKQEKKKLFRDIIEIIPQSYLYERTIELNYEVLLAIYQNRKKHKLSEWVEFCEIIKTLPYFSEIVQWFIDDKQEKRDILKAKDERIKELENQIKELKRCVKK